MRIMGNAFGTYQRVMIQGLREEGWMDHKVGIFLGYLHHENQLKRIWYL